MDRPIISVLSPKDLSFCNAFQNYTSLRWENKSAGAGDFEFHLPFEEPIQCGSIVKLSCDITEPYGVVLCVRLSKNKTTVIGKMLSHLLSYRYPTFDGADVTYFSSRGIPQLICLAAKYGCTSKKDYFFGKALSLAPEDESGSVSYDGSLSENCLAAMSSIANDAKKRFSVTIQSGAMKIISGSYSDCKITLDSAIGLFTDEVYTLSSDNSVNVFTYSLKENDSFFYQYYPTLSQPEGAERRVLYLGKFDTVPGCELRRKRSTLKECDSFEARVMPSIRNKLFPGGMVTVKKKEWDINKAYNITSVTDIWEDKYSNIITFGDTQPTAYEKIIQRTR